MTVSTLSSDQVETLRAKPFTYAAVGATASRPPDGFAFFTRTHTLNHQDFVGAAQDLMTWQVHRRAGLKVAASSPAVTADTVVLMRLGLGAAALRIPCRVVYVVNEPTVKGFAYGTLPGHPESGEECFLLSRRADGHIEFTVSAFSRPASHAARCGGPVSRWVQQAMTTRYLRVLDA